MNPMLFSSLSKTKSFVVSLSESEWGLWEGVSSQKQRDKGRDFIRVGVTLVLSLGVDNGNRNS